ncbi:MAG: hypothetical protein RSD95_01585 [Clostridia bacterium]
MTSGLTSGFISGFTSGFTSGFLGFLIGSGCWSSEKMGISKSGSASLTVRRTRANFPNMPNNPGLPYSSTSIETSLEVFPSSLKPA